MYSETVFYTRNRTDPTARLSHKLYFRFFKNFSFSKFFLSKIPFSKYGGYQLNPYRVFCTSIPLGSRCETAPHRPNLFQIIVGCRAQPLTSVADFANAPGQNYGHDTMFFRRAGLRPVPRYSIPLSPILAFQEAASFKLP